MWRVPMPADPTDEKQPVPNLCERCVKHGPPLHCDHCDLPGCGDPVAGPEGHEGLRLPVCRFERSAWGLVEAAPDRLRAEGWEVVEVMPCDEHDRADAEMHQALNETAACLEAERRALEVERRRLGQATGGLRSLVPVVNRLLDAAEAENDGNEEKGRKLWGEAVDLAARAYPGAVRVLASLNAGEPEPAGVDCSSPDEIHSVNKLVEFDAWLSFRPEFYEVLDAFRAAFGTDTSAAGDTKQVSTDHDGHRGGHDSPQSQSRSDAGGDSSEDISAAPSPVGEREPVPEAAPERIERMVCPECGEPANGAMWGPECHRFASHPRGEGEPPRSVKCVPVAYMIERPPPVEVEQDERSEAGDVRFENIRGQRFQAGPEGGVAIHDGTGRWLAMAIDEQARREVVALWADRSDR